MSKLLSFYHGVVRAPIKGTPLPGSVGAYLNESGRVEVIWFPFSDEPWLKVWTVAPAKPPGSVHVPTPYNYGFSDNLPSWLTGLLKQVLGGRPSLTPVFTKACGGYAALSAAQDIWGASKNTLIYVQDTTLRVTANGYAILMQKRQVQQAVADVTAKFSQMLDSYQRQNLWPINAPLEIRVTGLDDPSKVGAASAQSPVISALSVDSVVQKRAWDVAVWFDVLTIIPGAQDTQKAYLFYEELEAWIYTHFADGFRVSPECSKGRAYTARGGAWSNQTVIDAVRRTFTDGRCADDTWSWEQQTLARYDSGGLFLNTFLEQLLGP